MTSPCFLTEQADMCNRLIAGLAAYAKTARPVPSVITRHDLSMADDHAAYVAGRSAYDAACQRADDDWSEGVR